MQDILNALIPVFAMIAIGLVLSRIGFLTAETLRQTAPA